MTLTLLFLPQQNTLALVSSAWGKRTGCDFRISCEPQDRSLYQYQEKKNLFPKQFLFKTRQGKSYFKVLYGKYDFLKITFLIGDI